MVIDPPALMFAWPPSLLPSVLALIRNPFCMSMLPAALIVTSPDCPLSALWAAIVAVLVPAPTRSMSPALIVILPPLPNAKLSVLIWALPRTVSLPVALTVIDPLSRQLKRRQKCRKWRPGSTVGRMEICLGVEPGDPATTCRVQRYIPSIYRKRAARSLE